MFCESTRRVIQSPANLELLNFGITKKTSGWLGVHSGAYSLNIIQVHSPYSSTFSSTESVANCWLADLKFLDFILIYG